METVSVSSEYSITIDQVKGDVTIVHKFPRRSDDKGLITRDTRITISEFETLLSVALFGVRTHFIPDAAMYNPAVSNDDFSDIPF